MNTTFLHTRGYTVVDDIYTLAEVQAITQTIAEADRGRPGFRQTADLFAIRQFLKEIPAVHPLIFTDKLNTLIAETFGPDYFLVKSIYFDKPEQSNWFVAWHQDLTISVNRKQPLPGFGPWTVKQDQYAVQPPLPILEGMYTIRIHLDDTDEENGALRVLPGSHRKGIWRYSAEGNCGEEEVCRVKSGGAMIMRPLLQHASRRSTNGLRRRVIHLEFSNARLPEGLAWAEIIKSYFYRQ